MSTGQAITAQRSAPMTHAQNGSPPQTKQFRQCSAHRFYLRIADTVIFGGLPSPLPKNRGGLQPVPQSEQPSSPPEPPPAYNPPKLLRSPTPFRSATILSLPLTLNRSFPQVCPIMRTPAPRPVADMTSTHCSCSRTGIHPLASRSAITAIVARPITMTAQPINETKRAK